MRGREKEKKRWRGERRAEEGKMQGLRPEATMPETHR